MLTQIYDINTVRRLQRGLHKAAEQHRFVAEHIDSAPASSRQMEQMLYANDVLALEKAIERVRTRQLDLRMRAHGINVSKAECAVAELIAFPVERRPGCDEQPQRA